MTPDHPDLKKACPTCLAQPRDFCISGNGKRTTVHNSRLAGVPMGRRMTLRPVRNP